MPGDPEPEPDDAERQRKKDRKARRKIRSAWIGFVGRIVAQVIGAAATVALGLMIAHRVQLSEPPESPSAANGAAPVQAARPRMGAVSIAVLPLDNYSGDPGQEYFADGMTEALIADLARIRALRVISRTSAMQYKNARKPLPQIARELGVDVVIEGSVALAGRRVRVTAQLVDAHADRQLWAESYERELKDVLALQSEVARSVAREVKVVLSPQEQTRLARSRPVDPAAHALYMQGRYEWNKRTREGFRAARAAFERAIAQDPGYALAHAGLADAWNVAAWSFYDAADPREAMPKARAAAEKALQLDDTLGEAHASLGSVLFRYDWDFARAEQELVRALDLNPGYSTGRQWLSSLYAALGRRDEAAVEAAHARDLDPLSPVPRRSTAIVHYFGGRFSEAEGDLRAEIATDAASPGAYEILAEVLLAQGRAADAATELERAFGPAPADPGPRVLLAAARAATGHRTEALAVLDEMQRAEARNQPLSPRLPAILLAQLGDADGALRQVERAIDERSEFAVWLNVHPLLARMRSDPRFRAQLKRVGLPSI